MLYAVLNRVRGSRSRHHNSEGLEKALDSKQKPPALLLDTIPNLSGLAACDCSALNIPLCSQSRVVVKHMAAEQIYELANANVVDGQHQVLAGSVAKLSSIR